MRKRKRERDRRETGDNSKKAWWDHREVKPFNHSTEQPTLAGVPRIHWISSGCHDSDYLDYLDYLLRTIPRIP